MTYFFWDKQLHKVLRINRPANLVDAWNFDENKRVSILYSDYRMHAGPAFRGTAAAAMLRMTKRNLNKAWQEGNINPPAKSFPLGEPDSERYIRWWGEHHITEAHEYFLTVHMGRPRKDGEVIPRQTLPSRAELKAQLTNGTVLYVQGEDGQFTPLWEPPKF